MIILVVIAVLVIAVYLFMHQPKFGTMPSGGRLELIRRSPNYRDGQFQNLSHTPPLAEGVSYAAVMKEFFFNSNKRKVPASAIPSVKVNLLSLDPQKDIMVWFGHSSYFLQVDGKKILVDPVFSGHASPFKFSVKSFNGSNVYGPDDMPQIDYLFISHDHWDHLDYETVLKLKPKVGRVITGLGVAAHLERWGFDNNIIIEKDWNEEAVLDTGFKVNTTPARHFSGRTFKRNGSIWLSFVLTTPHKKIFLGGDSGYDTHFAAIGNKFGPFDLAILEDGQYDKSWKYIHMMPEEVVQAAIDLKARVLFPVHWGKFSLGNHDWDDPIIRVHNESRKKNMPLLHPLIGEVVNLDDPGKQTAWWQDIK